MQSIIPTDIENPIDGIVPDFSIFGVEFTELWQKLFAGLWGIAIIIAIVYLVIGITAMGKSSSSGNGEEYKTGRKQAMWAAISLGGLVALGIIVGAIIAVFG